jgi:serine/threonine protein kinase
MTQFVACPTCDRPVVVGDRFCANCGTLLGETSEWGQHDASIDRALFEALRHVTLGDYEILGELGRGGMAVVYLAHEIRLPRKVALKVLAPHLHSLPGMATRFLHEAQTAAVLEHPNIIPIYAHKETPDLVYFAMRYVNGLPLAKLAAKVGAFPVTLVRALLADVGGALSFAHRHNVLHRDVKPGNVMIGREGSVFVTDFGIAKRSDSPGLTLTGQFLGTPEYMSPELCRGLAASPASDQYALGIVLYELLAGRCPFEGDNPNYVMEQHRTAPVPPLGDFRPDSPVELTDAVMRMLEKDAADRFSSIDEAMWAAGATPLHPGDPLRAPLTKWVTEHSPERPFAATPVSPMVRSRSVEHPRLPERHATPHDPPVAPPTVDAGPTPAGSARAARTAAANRMLGPVLGGVVGIVAVVFIAWRLIAGGGVAVGDTGGGTTGGDRDEITPPPPPAVGTFVVQRLPAGGTLRIDGAVASGTHHSLSPGQHTIQLEAPGFVAVDTTVLVTAGDTSTLAYSGRRVEPPPPVNGTLVVRGLPAGGTIRVDGTVARGTRLTLEPGRHTVQLEASGFTTHEATVVVAAGATSNLTFTGRRIISDPPPEPPKAPGFLMLRVQPFAKIYVDGRFIVEDEVLRRQLPAGRHTLRFELDGFQTKDTTITVGSGETLRLVFAMVRKTQ